jgi:hypothetical protein
VTLNGVESMFMHGWIVQVDQVLAGQKKAAELEKFKSKAT